MRRMLSGWVLDAHEYGGPLIMANRTVYSMGYVKSEYDVFCPSSGWGGAKSRDSIVAQTTIGVPVIEFDWGQKARTERRAGMSELESPRITSNPARSLAIYTS